MDPVTVVGVLEASLHIGQFIAATIQGLNTLKGKFRDADTTIRLLIGQLSTIKAAILQIRDWAEFNFDDSPKERRFLAGLSISLDGCQAAIEVLSDEIHDLTDGSNSLDGEGSTALTTRARVKASWNDDSMKVHEDRLQAQGRALQLLLLAGQWYVISSTSLKFNCSLHFSRDAIAQSNLLDLKENQKVIQRVVDDTRKLREIQSLAGPPQATRSLRQPSQGDTMFDFDQGLEETEVYRATTARVLEQQQAVRMPTGSSSPRSDEDDETDTPQPDQRSLDLWGNPAKASKILGMAQVDQRTYFPNSLNPSAENSRDIQRSRSMASSSTGSEPESTVDRWLSSTPWTESPPRAADPGRKKWKSRLARLNTFGSSKLPNVVQKAQSTHSSITIGLAPEPRPKVLRDVNVNQSVDSMVSEGLETQSLVEIAQVGDLVEMERLLLDGKDIELRRGSTQRTALAIAAHSGLVDVVDILLEHGANPLTKDADLSTPLHLAASRDHCEVISLLVNHGVDVEATDASNRTPLWLAAESGHLRAVEMLLNARAKVNTRANKQLTPLHVAARRGDKDMVDLLLRYRAHIEARDINSKTALHHACEAGYLGIVSFLLQKGALIEAPGENSMTPILCAAASGHVYLVEFLFKKKASVKSVDERNANCLHWAAKNGHLEVAEYLLKSRDLYIPLNATDVDKLTALQLAVIGSHFAVVDFLLHRKAAIEHRCLLGWTSLHYACSSHNPDIVRLLLSAGANAESKVPGDNKRPIHIAAAYGSTGIVDVLYQKGVSISACDGENNRPLSIACQHGHLDVVKKLLEYGEPLTMPVTFGEDSPLGIAAGAGHLDIVELLVSKGASLWQRDEYGFVPLRYAAYYGHPEVLQFLLAKGAGSCSFGDDSKGCYSAFTPESIGFSPNNIPEERKARVCELLAEATGSSNDPSDVEGDKFNSKYRWQLPQISELPTPVDTRFEMPADTYKPRPFTPQSETSRKFVYNSSPVRSPVPPEEVHGHRTSPSQTLSLLPRKPSSTSLGSNRPDVAESTYKDAYTVSSVSKAPEDVGTQIHELMGMHCCFPLRRRTNEK
jgi:ankyrin repeat protein